MRYVMGIDLGQARDYTALTVLERQEEVKAYHCRHLQRFDLGAPYPQIISSVAELLARPPLAGDCVLVVDATGVGKAVTDLFTQEGLNPVAVTITSGDSVTRVAGGFHVPKRDLIANLQVLLQFGRLLFAADLPEISTLVQEMLDFHYRVTATGYVAFESWREGAHDDLILAVALAAWYAEKGPPGAEDFIRGYRKIVEEEQARVVGQRWRPPW